MFNGLTHVSDTVFYGGLIGVVLVCVIAIVVVAIRGALAMDRNEPEPEFEIKWDAIDQPAPPPSIVAGAFGKTRH